MPTDDLVREAEQITLGSMMVDPSVIDSVAEILRPGDFADARHGSIFAAIRSTHATGTEAGPVPVAMALQSVGELLRLGGAAYLHTLTAAVPTAASATWYAQVVANAAAARAAAADGVRLAQVAASGDVVKIAEVRARLVESWSTPHPAGASTWAPVDLGSVLDGTYEPPAATVGRRHDGIGLLYPGRQHAAYGESEAGKSWLALLIVAQVLEDGGAAAYVDFEDDAAGMVGRLRALGADDVAIRDRFAYLRPEEPLSASGNGDALDAVLGDLRPKVGILDGITEGMTLHGLDLRDNVDVARFNRLVPARLAASGAAVLSLDHVTKSADGRGRYAIGGQHKLAGLNGAAFLVENRRPFGIGVTGRSTVYVTKDRPAQLRQHAVPSSGGLHWLADLMVESDRRIGPTWVGASLTPPVREVETFRPTVLMHRVSEALSKVERPLTGREIDTRVTGQRQAVAAAVAALEDEGYVAVENGPRGAKLHRLIKPFGGDTEPAQ